MTRRIEQLTADIERGVRDVLSKGLADPRVSGLITVTGVRVAPDMGRAYIDISVLPEEKQELTLHGIASASTWIRREVANSVRARVLPQFVFRLDTRAKKEAAIIRELEKIKDRHPAPQSNDDATEPHAQGPDDAGT
ncbi:MAG: ribosome-binding factor A [Planctomycetota bacterium]|nr:ribosome-binding factor A [Planctomycetota bacterium]